MKSSNELILDIVYNMYSIMYYIVIPVYGAALSSSLSSTVRGKSINILRNIQGWRERYFITLSSMLSYIETRAGKYVISGRSFDWILRIAFFYPTAMYILIWVITGSASAGIAQALPDNAPLNNRLQTFFILLLSGLTYERASRITGIYRYILSFFSVIGIIIAGVLTGGDGSFAVMAGVCCASAVSIVGNVRSTKAYDKSNGVAFVFLGGSLGGAILAVLLYFLGETGILYQTARMITLIAFIAFLFSTLGKRARDKGYIGILLVIQVIMFLSAGVLAVLYINFWEVNPTFIAMYILWGILPFINAPFDWVSLIITVVLVRKMLDGRGVGIFFKSIIDLIISFLLLIGAAFSIMFYMSLIYGIGSVYRGHDFVNPNDIVEAMKKDVFAPSTYWLYFIASTTLWPTAFHILGAAMSAWTLVGQRIFNFQRLISIWAKETDIEKVADGLYIGTIMNGVFLISLSFIAGILISLVVFSPFLIKILEYAAGTAIDLGYNIAVYLI